MVIFMYLLNYSWYFGDISRVEAEKLLMSTGNILGTFLVRVSTSQKDSLSLSVRNVDNVMHYRIGKTIDGKFFIDIQDVFITLQVLMECLK